MAWLGYLLGVGFIVLVFLVIISAMEWFANDRESG